MLQGFYETVGRLFSRERIRETERMVRSAGYGQSAEAFVDWP